MEAAPVAVAGIFIILEALEQIQHPWPLPLIFGELESWSYRPWQIWLSIFIIYKVARETESLAQEASARSFREDAGLIEK